MENLIRFLLSNFTLTFFVIGLIASGIALVRAPKPLDAAVLVEKLFAYFLLFSIGFSFLYNFVMHTFFSAVASAHIGWEPSPFEAEVGFASLGFSAVGFLAFGRSFDLRLAAVTAPALFLLGAAGGHVHDMVTRANFAPGNAGVIFYTDILLPIIGFALLWLQHRHGREEAGTAPALA